MSRASSDGAYLALHCVGFTLPPSVTTGAVSSYLTVSPLPSGDGGFFSVALSVESPLLPVRKHAAL